MGCVQPDGRGAETSGHTWERAPRPRKSLLWTVHIGVIATDRVKQRSCEYVFVTLALNTDCDMRASTLRTHLLWMRSSCCGAFQDESPRGWSLRISSHTLAMDGADPTTVGEKRGRGTNRAKRGIDSNRSGRKRGLQSVKPAGCPQATSA